jgi:serine/threonine-protein kinase
MALHREGLLEDARKSLTAAIFSYDWRATQARDHDAWICHLLRREAEGLIVPDLPAFRRGEYQPQDKDERLALLAVQLASSQFDGFQGAAARLYADAFATEPKLAEDAPVGTRHRAARAAALAGCCQGQDADLLNDEERADLRRQALDWLREDLTWCGQRLEDGNAETNARIRQGLQFWLDDPDLAGVHDDNALARLPDAEREQWDQLWSDVEAMLQRVRPPE